MHLEIATFRNISTTQAEISKTAMTLMHNRVNPIYNRVRIEHLYHKPTFVHKNIEVESKRATHLYIDMT